MSSDCDLASPPPIEFGTASLCDGILNPPRDVAQFTARADVLFDLRKQMTPEAYLEQKKALQKFLCGCFSTGDCDNSLGNAMSPLKAAPRGGKVLKVRWAYPCCGKSGGVRLVVVAYSETKRVHNAKAFYRSDDPSDDNILDGVNDLLLAFPPTCRLLMHGGAMETSKLIPSRGSIEVEANRASRAGEPACRPWQDADNRDPYSG